MPPEHFEDATEQSKNRVEQLANSFASALLMPAAALDRFGPWEGDLAARLNVAAKGLAVTASALKWRLILLGRLDRRMQNVGTVPARRSHHDPVPPLFSKPFVEVIALAIKQGRVSARRAADLLDMKTLEDLNDLFAAQEVEPAFDL
jgi:hypothetical protein